ncbi:hypothetical protein BCR44DRAFT_35052 [Catenaria anguillulae PL171]|uniref:Ankyrin repeat-containing domain protein n=1 Tax=Catenaria anguillulae PL171 TaxID=765915 RepID=A0A1Y2HED8_9FUNG|nr:hypothetical protein BCR44DRAFT_35052 [Catenaria anguillulae PL171]
MNSDCTIPTLPTTLIDAILACVPLAVPKRTATISLLNVLSPRLILPTTLCAALIDAAINSSEFSTFCLPDALANLANHPTLDPSMVCRLAPAIAREPKRIGAVLVKHVAAAGNLPVLESLARCVDLKSCLGGLDLAAAKGRVDVLEWWSKTKCMPIAGPLTDVGIEGAVENNQLVMLEWIVERHPDFAIDWTEMIDAAAGKGHVSILDFCRLRLTADGDPFTDFGYDAWVKASEHGHVHVLVWAKLNNMPFPQASEVAVDGAIRNGHVDVLEWWYTQSPLPFKYTALGVNQASHAGHVHVLEWLSASGVEFRCTAAAKILAISQGKEAVVKWWDKHAMYNYLLSSRHKSVEPSQGVTSDFATLCSFGQLDLIDASQVPVNDQDALWIALMELAVGGHLEILIRFKDIFCPIAQRRNAEYISEAVNNNQVHLLQWCCTHFGFQFVDKAYWLDCANMACSLGHLEVLVWMVSTQLIELNPMPLELVESAISHGEMEILEYLFIEGFDCSRVTKMPDSSAVPLLVAAALCGQLKSLQWWIDKNLPFPASPEIAEAAAHEGHWLVLEWLHSMQPTVPFVWCESAVWAAVRGKHKMTCKWWLRSGLVKGPLLLKMLEEALVE